MNYNILYRSLGTMAPEMYRSSLIGGAFVRPNAKTALLKLVSPVNGAPVAEVFEATDDQVDDAVGLAAAAASAWRHCSTRASVLHRLAVELRQNRDEFARLETLSGKPWREAVADVDESAACFEYYAGLADKEGPTQKNVRREPVGVCALVTGFNYPLLLAAWKTAPALAAGNTVLLKPAQQTPLSSLRLGAAFLEAAPEFGNVLQVLVGGQRVGQALAEHPRVALVSLTGSTATGRRVAVAAANSNLKRVALELGGKAPVVVLPSANRSAALDAVVEGAFANAGQNCCAATRLYLHRDIYSDFMASLVRKTRQLRVGHPEDPSTTLGPLVDIVQKRRALEFVQRAREHSHIRVLTGGDATGDPQGCFVAPTILAGVREEDEIAQCEVFGPVLAVMEPFDDLAACIERANDSAYGLGAGIFTGDSAEAEVFVQRIDAGMVWVNSYGQTPVDRPFGGFKASGWGYELGEQALEAYSRVKTVVIG